MDLAHGTGFGFLPKFTSHVARPSLGSREIATILFNGLETGLEIFAKLCKST